MPTFKHFLTPLLLTLMMVLSSTWLVVESAAAAPSSLSGSQHHLHDHPQDDAHTPAQCNQHQGCHFHSPAAIHSVAMSNAIRPALPPQPPAYPLYSLPGGQPPVPPPNIA